MKPSRNVLLVLLLASASACVEPKPGGDHKKPDTGAADATTPADAVTADPDSAIADAGGAEDATEDDAGGAEDATDPIDLGVDAGMQGCVPTGPEVCDNGLDDDCQNGIDCNDPTCGRCLPVPAPFTGGVLVDAMVRCPAGFDVAETPLFAGLDPGPGCGAGSCSCTANATRCLGEIYSYSTQMQCMADTALTGGTLYGSLIDENCTTSPIVDGFPGGFRLGNWTVVQTCNAMGSASPSPYSWTETKKLCVAQLGAGGCDRGSVCVPSGVTERACLTTSGGAMCPGPFSDRATQYYTGLTDTRSCGPCECTASGGSCEFAQLTLGSDWACGTQWDVSLSLASPQRCSSEYSPPARVTGWPTDPTCSTYALEDGSIQATGQQTVCCLP